MSAAVRPWRSVRALPCSCRMGMGSLRRSLHTSASRKAREVDFYRTLDVSKGADQREIKAQFYKLSKKWHPDVNQGSEESKVKFQEVSEAYATLGQESSRRQYDRQMSDLGFGSASNGVGRASGGFHSSDNLQRRATASYAWDYHRRNAARAQRQANRPGGTSKGGGADAHFHHGGSAAFGWGSGGAHQQTSSNSSSMFERLAEQQRKREAAANARSGNVSSFDRAQSQQESEKHDMSAGHFFRFLQITAMFGAIAFVASFAQKPKPGAAAIQTAGTGSRKRYPAS